MSEMYEQRTTNLKRSFIGKNRMKSVLHNEVIRERAGLR